jgi:hypothetical protein
MPSAALLEEFGDKMNVSQKTKKPDGVEYTAVRIFT